MKRVVIVLALALILPVFALATQFDYYTVGQFSALGGGVVIGGGGSSATVNGTTTISFANQGDSTCTAACVAFGSTGGVPNMYFSTDPTGTTNATLGTFHTTSTATPPGDSLANVGFTLTVYQVVPGVGNGSFFGSLNGTVVANSSDGKFYLDIASPDNFVLDNALLWGLVLDNESTCGTGKRCIQIGGPGQDATAKASVTAVPEPASIMLFGSGLTGLAGLIRRRRK